MELSKKRLLYLYSLVSGLFFLTNNAIAIIIPLTMLGNGVSFSGIGSVLAIFSMCSVFIKIIIGRHSDLVGKKTYLLISLFLASIAMLILMFSSDLIGFIISIGILGISRGIFTTIRASYIMDFSDHENRGESFGILSSVLTVFQAIGGAMAGAFYHFNQGFYVFLILFVSLAIAFIISMICFHNNYYEKQSKEKLFSWKLLRNTSKYIWIFCIIEFLQGFITGSMWNLIVPVYFVTVFNFAPIAFGVAMSLDELISSPVSLIAGKISDKVEIKKMLIWCFLLAGIISLFILISKNAIVFLIVFLICSVFVTTTFICLEKAESIYVRDEAKGFEFAMISVANGIGDGLGKIFFGVMTDIFSISFGVFSFFIIYTIITLLLVFYFKTQNNTSTSH